MSETEKMELFALFNHSSMMPDRSFLPNDILGYLKWLGAWNEFFEKDSNTLTAELIRVEYKKEGVI